MRLIDADALIQWLDVGHLRSPSELCYSELDVKHIINAAPTIDVQPVRRGEWVDVPYVYIGLKRYICNQCADEEYWENRYLNTKENFCPNCGAAMKGGTP